MSKKTVPLVIEVAEDGLPEHEPYGSGFVQQINFRTTPEQHAELLAYAEEKGIGVGRALRYAIKLLTGEGDE